MVTPEADGFLVYVAEEDRSWVIPRLELVEAWLDEHKAAFRGLTAWLEEARRVLGRDPDGGRGT